eukprot:TRINITY_DN8668_c0_g1_i1.p1 TRINITY_DN8668_c0_g1~~TRINITY_DN8668_c0_g1_i1.p1  ORF type:complete len:530 (+),score=66.60 TRINITY_DN8668_c0_g1_i1:161-1750(+)
MKWLRLGLLLFSLLNQRFDLCWALNAEGLALLRFRERVTRDPYGALSNWNSYESGDYDPCSWFGVECSDDGKVLSLNLKDLCLGGTLAPELGELIHIESMNTVQTKNAANQRLLQQRRKAVSLRDRDIEGNSQQTPLPSPVPMPDLPPSISNPFPNPSDNSSQSVDADHRQKKKSSWTIFFYVGLGVSFVLVVLAISIFLCQNNRAVTVRPWATGLSGQLQKAFVTGVPSLKRSEIETACEDFSNIIGSLSDSTVYKGTLSSGVEIAVISSAVTSAKDWSKQLESQFRKKINTLSKVNHKNFMNLLGYCEEEEPFTRMMVFEYAPNGTLFEHLHIKEAEHLDWAARLRIAMGMAYCLEHMHQLNPPIIQKNLNSTSVYLTEDYAAKISDLGFWSEAEVVKIGPGDTEPTNTSTLDLMNNIYNFGVILLEMISGKLLPISELCDLLDYLVREQNLKQIIDPTLKSFREEDVGALCDVVQRCLHPVPNQRPTMREVAARLREITAMPPDGAVPKLSPLWWAELEIISTEGS